MSDIRLFTLNNGTFLELNGEASDLEKPLQTLMEANLETLLGIRFVASEYPTGKVHGGRIDTLEQFGKEAADSIDWSGPRLVCVAADFTKYDSHAVLLSESRTSSAWWSPRIGSF